MVGPFEEAARLVVGAGFALCLPGPHPLQEAMSTTNTLARATSPYLLQHAGNPVHWQVWGEEAIALARRERRPILLSIGYAACHWCHVMARESFSDPATAALMNRLFVNIKVDREERPDLDRVYQLAHQLIAGQGGGWPLTSFLDPETLVPFFSGTYFPDRPRYGMPAFAEVLERVADYFQGHGEAIAGQRQELTGLLSAEADTDAGGLVDGACLDLARQQLGQRYDPRHGGFGGAPKFPQPGRVERLLRHWRRQARAGREDPEALAMAVATLEAMARGGIYDQLAGGFFRYSVDERWEIPHFEKMLSDNGQLLALYAEAWAVTRRPLFRRVVVETAAWLLADMRSDGGAFHASLDADSEGREGAFYVWEADEVRGLIGEDRYGVFAGIYGLDGPANFEGAWHLRFVREADEPAERSGRDRAEVEDVLAASRRRLLAERARRPRPRRDDKILTGWNALAIRGLAIAARHTGDAACRQAAFAALEDLCRRVWRDGRLHVAWSRGQVGPPGFLDDHAYLADAVLELLQLDWRPEWLDLVERLAAIMIERFHDAGGGGFFYSAVEHKTPIHRPRAVVDDALPAATGVAARVLGRLALILDEPDYEHIADAAIASAARELAQTPSACNALLTALEDRLSPVELVVVRGPSDALAAWRDAALADYAPQRLVFAIDEDLDGLPPGLATYRPADDGRTIAYVCRAGRCEAPIRCLEGLREVLDRP